MRLLSLILFGIFSICAPARSDNLNSQPRLKVKLALTSQPENALIHLAISKGYFDAEGLDVNTEIFQFGRLALEAAIDGRADIATAAETPLMFNILKDTKLFILASMATSNSNNAIIARREMGISKASDLRGKVIGFTPGTTGDFFLSSLLTTQGLKRSDVKGIELKPDEMKEALLAKKVDAVSTWNFALAQIELALGANGVTIYDKDVYSEVFNIVAMQDYTKQNPAILAKFLRAVIKAEDFALKNPSEVIELVASAAKVEYALLKKIWSAFKFHLGLEEILLITLEDEARWAISNKLTDKSQIPDFTSYIYFDSLKAIKPEAIKIKR